MSSYELLKPSDTPSKQEHRQIERILSQATSDPFQYAQYIVDTIRKGTWIDHQQHRRLRAPNFSDAITTSRMHMENALLTRPHDLFAYFRLKTQSQLIEPIFYGPVAFQSNEHFLVTNDKMTTEEKTYMDTGLVLLEAMNLYDHQGNYNSMNRRHLKGVINELTPLALLNRPSKNGVRRLALPAALLDDSANKVDLEYYTINQDGTGDRLAIQVKSSDEYLGNPSVIPENGILLTASDFMNTGKDASGHPNFTVSRLIMEELSGNPRSDVSDVLDMVTERMIQTIEERRP
jgi:hypothetical protein